MPWGAVAGAVITTAGSALMKSDVSSGSSSANKVSQATVDEAKSNYAPYTTAGANALTQYANLSGINGQDAANTAMNTFQSSPGYAYQVSEGLKGVDAGAASKGLLHSGATIKAEETLGSNLANQNYSSYLNNLYNISGLGVNALNSYENVASGQSTNQQKNTTGAAATQASITGNTASGLANSVGTAYKNGLFDNLFGSSNSASSADGYNPFQLSTS